MPEYEYRCSACRYEFSESQEMKKYKAKKKCPSCKKHKLERVLGCFTAFARAEPTTLGQLAERNTAKFGRYELDKKQLQQNKGKNVDKKDQPWYHKGGGASQNEVFKMTPEQKKKYIQEGKK
jgi:putative FmdB family regulatory protein